MVYIAAFVINISFYIIFAEPAETIDTAFQDVDDGEKEKSGMCE